MAQNLKTKTQVVEVPTQAPKVDAKLISLTIFYLVAIVNAAANYFGFELNISADADALYDDVTVVLGFAAFVVGIWKNNNFSKKARKKDHVAKQVNTK
jgi:SPP1 family holin